MHVCVSRLGLCVDDTQSYADTWSTLPCAVTCNSQPPQPLYGNLACAVGTAAGGVCNGTCSTGYVGSPAPYALCMATGAWAVLGQCVNGE